jgi:hypothetical protein
LIIQASTGLKQKALIEIKAGTALSGSSHLRICPLRCNATTPDHTEQ